MVLNMTHWAFKLACLTCDSIAPHIARSSRFPQHVTVSVRSCQCPFGWKGALCTETVSVCDSEHVPPPLCAHGSACIPLPKGYTCHCPLGTAGIHCEKGRVI